MTENAGSNAGQQPPAGAAPVTAPSQQTQATEPPQASSGLERAGTVLMSVAVAAVVIILLDFAFNGRILGPLFARLPAPSVAADDDAGDTGDG